MCMKIVPYADTFPHFRKLRKMKILQNMTEELKKTGVLR